MYFVNEIEKGWFDKQAWEEKEWVTEIVFIGSKIIKNGSKKFWRAHDEEIADKWKILDSSTKNEDFRMLAFRLTSEMFGKIWNK